MRLVFHLPLSVVALLCALVAGSRAASGAPETPPGGDSRVDVAIEFNLPSQTAAHALLAFSKQTKIEVLFSFDALRQVRSTAVQGRLDPVAALKQLLRGTGFSPRSNGRDRFVVTSEEKPVGSIRGTMLGADGWGAPGVRVTLHDTRHVARTDALGAFELSAIPPGNYRLIAIATGFQASQLIDVQIEADQVVTLPAHILQAAQDPEKLAPFVVNDKATRRDPFDRSEAQAGPRVAGGNLDLARTENDALPFTIYNRDQIARSGVVSLNEFLQRELLDGDAAIRPPEQDGTAPTFTAGSTNLNLRGYGSDQTIVLVNGRRLPEALTSLSGTLPPDVNFIPLSLVQQVEVLPVSAASLYSGNAVGGIINIVLRPGVDAEATEVALTYTNAIADYDAPQSSASVMHARSLLRGQLRVRFNASFTKVTPPTENELGFRQARPPPALALQGSLYRATPNVRGAYPITDDEEIRPMLPPPLFGPGTASVTSVPPGADGTGGLSAFRGREGVRNFTLFDVPAGLMSSLDSVDSPYGREQRRTAYFGSAVFDATPWLQLAFDGTFTQTVINRGYDVLAADLRLRADSPFNPFGQEALVSLNEVAWKLGEKYSEARLEFGSGVLSALLLLPRDWRVLLDTQYGRNIAKYRGLAGADYNRWQDLVDAGRYHPLRDTQVHPPPQEFYDQVLIHRGSPGRFVTLGDYSAIDAAVRATNHALNGPTGTATLNLGADYRRNELRRFTDERRYSDHTLAAEPLRFQGRAIERYSVFGELQAPLLPSRWRPSSIQKLDANLAVRYIAANQSRETNLAPTFALKAQLPAGFTVRGSVSTSSRYPSPQMARLALVRPAGGGAPIGVDRTDVFDPVQDDRYRVGEEEVLNPNLSPEGAVTQTAGVLFRRGEVHRFRTSVDFVDTNKVNELVHLDAQTILNLEPLFPDRVWRGPPTAENPDREGVVTTVFTGSINAAWRRSHNWNTSLDYAWTDCLGGTLELYARTIYFSRYTRLLVPGANIVDELEHPEGGANGLLKIRAKMGAGWSNQSHGFGVDGHYFHSRMLPVVEHRSHGSDRIRPYWQCDAYVQGELGRWVPWLRGGTRLQLRVNNVFAFPFPRYEHAAAGAGVQVYGDWRGRVYSLSLTSTF